MNEPIVCVDPIEGYLTEGKTYHLEKIESYAGRAVMIDDNGKEGHFKPERFTLYGMALPDALKMKKVQFTRIESNHQNLRTNEMLGRAPEMPEVGKELYLFGESLTNYMGTRLIRTTEIKDVQLKDGVYRFTTQNSTYEMKVLE